MTHLLNEFPMEILRRLGAAPATETELSAALAQACGVEDDAAWRRKVSSTLEGLEVLGLIDRAVR